MDSRNASLGLRLLWSIAAVLFSAVAIGDVYSQQVELRWGEYGDFSLWDRPLSYAKSDYEFAGRLPDLREFPKLLAAAADPKWEPYQREMIYSQMCALSRCDFAGQIVITLPGEPQPPIKTPLEKWQAWWDNYGKNLAATLEQDGRRYEAAWKEIAPTPYLECPKYPLAIPQTWSTTISFRSGDYFGVTEEVIEFEVSDARCVLRRRYKTGGILEHPWTHEVWEDFTREEATQFLAALLYAIDNPWFYRGDEIGDDRGHIRGRPAAWSTYYPGYEWTGILDADKRVIINHDPWHWHTVYYPRNDDLFRSTSLDYVFGVLFRVVRDKFPDPSWIPERSRWKKIDPTPRFAADEPDKTPPQEDAPKQAVEPSPPPAEDAAAWSRLLPYLPQPQRPVDAIHIDGRTVAKYGFRGRGKVLRIESLGLPPEHERTKDCGPRLKITVQGEDGLRYVIDNCPSGKYARRLVRTAEGKTFDFPHLLIELADSLEI
ncbi:hypothetical protein [Blastopirellula marina]|uniref:Uncharacterized protein n=1 Tax=Blastopirellula marina TaxID=124 RepID=A0A2S8F272_9BACT|nr:hypothetical protein [Blastopirellula marina]PQO26243.1 hypothetical protein C5Y98_30815 [Blastopirellula marina]PTL40642.1 hypothetical protein C5Y97_30830 [Blastopirellula marina]